MTAFMSRFDVIVIGAGRTGRTIAREVAARGRRVALVSLNDDPGSVFRRTVETVATGALSPLLPPASLDNVETFRGDAVFETEGPVLSVAGERLSARRYVIATGARPILPAVNGLREAKADTPLSLYERPRLPSSVVVLGGGPIGTALSGRLAAQGVRVTLLMTRDRLLPAFDPEIAAVAARALAERGVSVVTGAAVRQMRRNGDGSVSVGYGLSDSGHEITAESAALCAGFEANSRGFGFERQGVYVDAQGRIVTDDRMRTPAPHIFAAGSVTGPPFQIALAAGQADLAVNNITSPFFAQMRADPDPAVDVAPGPVPLARFGLSEEESARTRDAVAAVYASPAGAVFKIVGRRRSGDILGAQAAGEGAAAAALYLNLAMRAGVSLFELLDRQFYPALTPAEAIGEAIDRWAHAAGP